MEKRKRIVVGSLLYIIILLISLIAVTNGSMWGDELCRIEESIDGDFANNWVRAVGYGQPGYMIWMFLWVQFIGKTEFILRTSNLVFVSIAFYYAYKIIKSRRIHPLFTLLFFVHPMFIYYMDEVTPYIAVYTLSLAFIYYVFYAESFDSKKNIILINIVFLAGVFIHFVFGFIYILYIYKVFSARQQKMSRHLMIFLFFCIAYIPLLVLDCYGLFLSKSTTTGTGFGLKNILYICYGFLGFAGLGISRNDLRAGHFDAMGISNLVGIGILSIILLGIGIVWFVNRHQIKFSKQEMITGTVLYFIVFFAFSMPIDFGMWERHCMGVLPVYIIMIIDLFEYILRKRNLERILVAGYCICLLFSAWNMRFNYYYACDDWKSVSEYLIDELEHNEKLTIIISINGDSYFDTGRYYDITGNRKNVSQKIIKLQNKEEIEQEIASEKKSDKLIIVLFEKGISSQMYTAYDDNSEFHVINSFNSFKIVERSKQ